jgi:uncharacterized protein YndB with AHSA1/START domain
MTERSVLHNIFTLERTFNASPERVFNAFSDAESKLDLLEKSLV